MKNWAQAARKSCLSEHRDKKKKMFVTYTPRAQATWPFAMYFSVTAENSAATAVQDSIEETYTETQQEILDPEPQNPHTACKGQATDYQRRIIPY